ncbi:MAG: glycoside hydrolase family 27 protein [Solirubrobacterales bacterium]|nr:glycoside hydrolase family 27 protein [Solirubrobacterales bacterium]
MLAATPYMGWSTYYGGGQLSEPAILATASRMRDDGLQKAGYKLVWLDWGWAGARRSKGRIIVNRYQWPHGMKYLTDRLHAEGFKAGIYTDTGRSGCNGNGIGSLGHYRADMRQFAAWGFDAVKVDDCGGVQQGVRVTFGQHATPTGATCAHLDRGDTRALPGHAHHTGPILTPSTQYRQVAQAIRASGRPMILSVANLWDPGEVAHNYPTYANSAYSNYTWASRFAASWRTDTDIGFAGCIRWPWVLRNFRADTTHPAAARPGHWNDPDDLAAGVGLNFTEARAQTLMWSMLAAPLMLGGNPLTMSARALRMLENPRVIAVDQDPRGIQARQISPYVWSKPLVNGRAVAFFNTTTRPLALSTSAHGTACNVWTGRCRQARQTLSARVAPNTAIAWTIGEERSR